MPFCCLCGRFYFVAGHGCHCRPYTVEIPEFDTSVNVRARDAEEAAEAGCRQFDYGDYVIIGQGGADVVVEAEDGTRTEWNVDAETVAEYHAKPGAVRKPGEVLP